eukprot:2849313-Rhodomonas_salina.1
MACPRPPRRDCGRPAPSEAQKWQEQQLEHRPRPCRKVSESDQSDLLEDLQMGTHKKKFGERGKCLGKSGKLGNLKLTFLEWYRRRVSSNGPVHLLIARVHFTPLCIVTD